VEVRNAILQFVGMARLNFEVRWAIPECIAQKVAIEESAVPIQIDGNGITARQVRGKFQADAS
jgi:hypothetical protein